MTDLRYPVTVRDNLKRWCPTCGDRLVVYVQVNGAESLTCCCACSRILERVVAASCERPCEQHDDCDRPCARLEDHDGRCECKNHTDRLDIARAEGEGMC